MALAESIFNAITITASGSLTAKTFVKFDGSTCGAGEKSLGVAYDEASSGDNVTIETHGLVKMLSGGAVNVGDPIKSDANGKGVTGIYGTDIINGYAVTSTTAADQEFLIFLV